MGNEPFIPLTTSGWYFLNATGHEVQQALKGNRYQMLNMGRYIKYQIIYCLKARDYDDKPREERLILQ